MNLNDITHTVKHSKNTCNLDQLEINEKFIQMDSIPENMIKIDTVETIVPVEKKVVRFKENEIIEVPSLFTDMLDMNNFYMYGTFNVIDSIMYIIDKSHKLKSIQERKDAIESFKQDLILNISSLLTKYPYYKDNNYKKNKLEMSVKKETYDKCVLKLLCDYKGINIAIIDSNTKYYIYLESEEISNHNIILIKLDNHLLPLIHIYGYIFNNDETKNIVNLFQKSIQLKKISNYTLGELRDLAKSNNITLTTEHKNKTKLELYNELTLLTI